MDLHVRRVKMSQDDGVQEGQTRETEAQDRFWRMRPDGIAVLPPIGNKAEVFCILEYKHMSDLTDQYLLRSRLKTEDLFVSLRSALIDTIHDQGWKVEQISFITGACSVNKQDLRENLKFFRVPEDRIESIY
jgi:hypothetical protein